MPNMSTFRAPDSPRLQRMLEIFRESERRRGAPVLADNILREMCARYIAARYPDAPSEARFNVIPSRYNTYTNTSMEEQEATQLASPGTTEFDDGDDDESSGDEEFDVIDAFNYREAATRNSYATVHYLQETEDEEDLNCMDHFYHDAGIFGVAQEVSEGQEGNGDGTDDEEEEDEEDKLRQDDRRATQAELHAVTYDQVDEYEVRRARRQAAEAEMLAARERRS